MLLGNLVFIMTFLVAVDCVSQSVKCNSDFRGSSSRKKIEKDIVFPSSVKETTFDVPQCRSVVGVNASACNDYPFDLIVMGPDSVYFSRSPDADSYLRVHVEVFCAP